MTKLVSLYDDDADYSPLISDNVIQPSIMSTEYQKNYHESGDYSAEESGRFFRIYNTFFSPVYVYYVTVETSYVYTDTTTFFIRSCIPQPFSYPICRTLPG